ncbi:matrixin family metalloprotease [Streptomyces sp. NPDC091272]|uniref:matrixin family metalloprotease n=1 Tax=Streptomyces sp. NPDC091272 TaxID=3365981 RepID=UPI00381C5E65
MPRIPLLRPVAVVATLTATLLGTAAPPAAPYDIVGPAWQDPDLTWRIVGYSRRDSLRGKRPTVERVIASAMRQWEKADRNIRFRKVAGGPADVEIRFVTRDDHTESPVDGPGGVAAYAYFPPRGELHFDDDEPWTLSPRGRAGRHVRGRGLDLYQSAIHELGHTLGLGHSDDPGSVMQPDVTNRRTLGRDDVRALHELYGGRRHAQRQHRRHPQEGVADFTVPPSPTDKDPLPRFLPRIAGTRGEHHAAPATPS